MMRRPIALRGDTTFFPPHMLGAIVHPYVQDMPGPQGAGLTRLLQESTLQPLSLSAESAAFFQVLCKETIGRSWEVNITPCCCAAVTVSLAPERFPLQANTFRHAAGTAGKQKWSLTYQAVQEYRSSRTSPLLEQDIPSWTTRRTRSSSLATSYNRSNALEEAFSPSSRTPPSAISMPVLILGRS